MMKDFTTSCNCDLCELKGLFFEKVTQNELDNLCNNKIEKEFKKGEIIFETGTPIEEFIYLKSGLVKLFTVYTNNKEQIISFAKPFDFVSLLNVFSDSTYSYSVMAIEDSVTCNIEFSKVKELVLKNGKFALNLLEKMSQVSDKIIQESLKIRQKHLRGRVAYLLLYFADYIFQREEFELPVSRKEIAEFIGMTPENVIRTLSEFRKDGILKIFGKTIEINKKDKLIQISNLG